MVPTFTCGLLRSNFSLAIFVSAPQPTWKNLTLLRPAWVSHHPSHGSGVQVHLGYPSRIHALVHPHADQDLGSPFHLFPGILGRERGDPYDDFLTLLHSEPVSYCRAATTQSAAHRGAQELNLLLRGHPLPRYSARGLGNHFLRHGCRGLFVMREMHGKAAASLRAAAQFGGVAKHGGQRHL